MPTRAAVVSVILLGAASIGQGQAATHVGGDSVVPVPQWGHMGVVRTLAFSPDGALLASGGSDSVVRISEAGRPRVLRILSGHVGRVQSLCFSPDSRLLASGGADKTVRLWDVATGRPLWIVQHVELGEATAGMEKEAVEALMFSPDGLRVASMSAKRLSIWSVQQGALVGQLPAKNASFAAIRFLPDGRLLACLGESAGLTIVDAERGKAVGRLARNGLAAFNPDGTLLAVAETGLADVRLAGEQPRQAIEVYDWRSGRLQCSLEGHRIRVSALSFSASGSRLLSGGSDAAVRVWEITTGELVAEFAGHGGPIGRVTALSGEPGDTQVASSSDDRTITVWNVATGRASWTLEAAGKPVESLAFRKDARYLAVGGASAEGDIHVWDTRAGLLAQVLRAPPPPADTLVGAAERFVLGMAGDFEEIAERLEGKGIAVGAPAFRLENAPRATSARYRGFLASRSNTRRSLAYAKDGSLLVSGSLWGAIHVWDTANGTLVGSHSGPCGRVVGPLALDGDGFVVTGDDLGCILVRRPKSGAFVRSITPAHKDGVVALAHNVQTRTTASTDGNSIQLWTSQGDASLAAGATSLDFSPDGQRLVSAKSSSITVWDVATRAVLRKIEGRPSPVQVVRVDPTGTTIVSGSRDGVLQVWDIDTGGLLRTLPAHLGEIWALDFSPLGSVLATGSADGCVKLWDLRTGQELATAVAFRNGADWLVTTPDGLFDGSPGGWSQLRWRFGSSLHDTSPAEAFFNDFYYPGLLSEILGGRQPKAPRDIAALDRRQPEVKLSLLAGGEAASEPFEIRRVGVRLDVAAAPPDHTSPVGSGAFDLRLFRNGSLVKVWRGDVLRGAARVTLETTTALVAGENRFTAYCFSRDNVKSPDAAATLTGADTLRRPGTAYVVAVGLNSYANHSYDLRYAVADARAFGAELLQQQARLGTFGTVEVVSLFDQDATKGNVLLALRRLAGTHGGPLPAGAPATLARLKPAEPEDAVFVYYAGHGTARGPRFYLVPHDLGYSGSRTALDPAGLEKILAHSISDIDLEAAFEGVDAGWMLLVVDACNSGQALEAEEKRRGPMNSKGLAQLAYEKGMNVLAAAQGFQAALEAAQLGHGYLTYALVEEGLKSLAADAAPKDGEVVVREWLDYATERVPQMQLAMMQDARRLGRAIVFVESEEGTADIESRNVQRPRVFYRREPEARRLVVAKAH